jgi:hypothetical protein
LFQFYQNSINSLEYLAIIKFNSLKLNFIFANIIKAKKKIFM